MRFRTVLQPALALLVAAPAAQSAPFKVRAFGDSITYGDFDTPDGYGYPGRLEDRLLAAGWNVDVVNDGINGERTVQALSRIDAELAQGGDLFLLMEGTNDIHRSTYSEQTTLFNLNVLATKAEDAGMSAVQASLIPRYPCATKDVNNVLTEGLGDEVAIQAASAGRDFVDVFAYFESLPNLFTSYYNNYTSTDNCPDNDPVGHPNAAGYGKLTDPFEDLVLEILESGPGLKILPPASPMAGVEVGFGAQLYRSDYTRIDWTFGDGGRQSVTPVVGVAPTAFWIYLEPGTYPVTATWHRSNGTSGTIETEVTVGGTAPGWTPRISFVPGAVREGGPWPHDQRFQLDLTNADGAGWVARGTLLEEAPPGDLIPLTGLIVEPPGPDPEEIRAAIREGVPAPLDTPRLWWIPQAGGVTFSDLILSEFDDDDRTAGLLLEIFHGPGASDVDFSATGHTYRWGQEPLGDVIPEIPASSWNGDARSLPGLAPSSPVRNLILLTNLGAFDQTLTLRLLDGGATEQASQTVSVLRGTTYRGELSELFPGIGAFSGPFTIAIDASPVPFVAAAVVTNGENGHVDYVAAVF